ncbi:regulatory protein RecX [Spongiibacter sp. KMU-158]|uniref:Regulatory protein RecX n=1 Tax=Spongiibacter pelagi TaxID=2760804 RepID=A0A927GW18_9GAMM|nr:regulatory protein RecX [Spongiibacter pelagi]MBD2858482.1 regulatory protein RecX [Spongiibacter pelagi]
MVFTVEIRRKAMDLLALREHSAKELKDKLLRKFESGDEITVVIAQLQEDGLQSDARFAEAFCRQRVASGYGPLRIKMELAQRGVDQSLGDAYFQQHPEDWFERCEQVRLKKFGDWPKPQAEERTLEGLKQAQKEKARQQRFLYSRGFPPSIINEILS